MNQINNSDSSEYLSTRHTPVVGGLTSDENREKVFAAFHGRGPLGVNDVASIAGLSPGTTRRALNDLVKTKQIEKKVYRARIGWVYAPVAEAETLLTLGDMALSPTQVLDYLLNTPVSPYVFLNQDKWNDVRKLILFKLYVHSSKVDVPVPDDYLNELITRLRDQAREFLKLLNSLSGPSFTNPDHLMTVGGELDSLDSGYNTYVDLLNRLSNTPPVAE
jgi:hypothetical protein